MGGEGIRATLGVESAPYHWNPTRRTPRRVGQPSLVNRLLRNQNKIRFPFRDEGGGVLAVATAWVRYALASNYFRLRGLALRIPSPRNEIAP